MRTEVKVFFAGDHSPGGAKVILAAALCGSDVATIDDLSFIGRKEDVKVTLDVTDPRLPTLRRTLKENGVQWTEHHEDRHTEEELNNAHLIAALRDNQFFVNGGASCGTTYSLDEACPVCGAGAKQTSLMLIYGDEVENLRGLRATATLRSDILVDERLADTLAKSGAVGLSLRHVSARLKDKHRVKLPWRQLCADHVLPPMSERSTGIAPYKPCSACKRSGYTTKRENPFRPVYRARDLVNAEDVNTSWEWFFEWRFNGKVKDALFGTPWFFVTPKVMRIIRAAEDKVFHWIPIRVEHPDGSIEGPPVPVPAV